MKKFALVLATVSLAIAGSAFAQNASQGVRTSNDPARAAVVEKHAADLRAQQRATPAAAPAVSTKGSARHHATKPHAKKHHAKKHHAKKHHAKRHVKHPAKHA